MKRWVVLGAVSLLTAMAVYSADESGSSLNQVRLELGRGQTMPFVHISFELLKKAKFRMSRGKKGPVVSLTKPFFIGIYEVTNEQWDAVMLKEGLKVKPNSYPKDGVSWERANEFLDNLHKKCKEHFYELPTEAQWEFACRAGSNDEYCYGDGAEKLSDYGWFSKNSGGKPHPVGQKKPNGWGLYDMHGNVWEWCRDTFGPLPTDEKEIVDPLGPKGSDLNVFESKVRRGGAFDCSESKLRSDYRSRLSRYNNLTSHKCGFRIVYEVD